MYIEQLEGKQNFIIIIAQYTCLTPNAQLYYVLQYMFNYILLCWVSYT